MKYNLTKVIDIFNHAGIFAFPIEGTLLSIANKEETVRAGKNTNQGEEVELDGIAIKGRVVWLIEYTNSQGLDTLDFDNFIQKITLLSDNDNQKLDEAIKKIWEKYELKIPKPDITKDTLLLGLYVAPFKNENQESTLMQRIPSKNKQIFLWCRDNFEYFNSVSLITRSHSQYELYSYFSLTPSDVFDRNEAEDQEKGSIRKPYIDIENGIFGCRMIIFKTDPKSLLCKTYVLRNEGWKSDSFQRMIIPEKLRRIRDYIINQKGSSFANNIIVSLDPNINPATLETEIDREIALPKRFGSLCIIDGQHRLLAFTQDFYSEQDNNEKKNDEIIKGLLTREELIVTLLVFNGSPTEILRKQTQIFRDINATQTRVKSDFIYNLEEIINPKSIESVGNKILKHLSKKENGVFSDRFSIKWYQGGRIKRSSVVKWGLADLVDPQKPFLYTKASTTIKEKYSNSNVDDYVLFCANILEDYFSVIRKIYKKKYLKKNFWDFPAKSNKMLLSTSAVVGFLRLFRHFLYSKIKKEEYEKYLTNIKVNFSKKFYKFTSSQWAKLEEAMFDDIREKSNSFGDETLIKRSKK